MTIQNRLEEIFKEYKDGIEEDQRFLDEVYKVVTKEMGRRYDKQCHKRMRKLWN